MDSLPEKLATVTDYVPQAVAPVDQLVEVAQRFGIPMGIEWVESAYIPPTDQPRPSGKRSVKELIEQIASVAPEHRVEVADGLVRIYSPTESFHPFNFLNIRLESYDVKDADVFAAEDRLRWIIRFTLEPKKYLNGYAGGYGHAADHIFQIQKFTLSESAVTVREILNRIALAQGNALWVATIKRDDLKGDEPCWSRKAVNCGDLPVTSAWRFIPLADITPLAKERVAVDVMIAGLLDKRMTTIPLMLEHGLAGDSGGSIGGASSTGISYQYTCSIVKLAKEFVTLSVRLKVQHGTEAEFIFDEKLKIYKDRISDIRPDPGIRIRAYFEGLAKP